MKNLFCLTILLAGLVLSSCSISPGSQGAYNSLQETYCNSLVSEEVIGRHFLSHFGILHGDEKYYPPQVELGAPWERTVSLPIDLNEIDAGLRWRNTEELLSYIDSYVMKSQLHGIWLMMEIFVFGPIQDHGRIGDVLKRIAERYDMDGIDDMDCLKYPVKYFGIGNEISSKEFYDGTEEDYFAILQTSYTAIKEANPEAKIIQAGLISPAHDVDIRFWDRLFDMGAAGYFDIVNFHEIRGDENFLNLYHIHSYLRDRGIEKPIWITEVQFEFLWEYPSMSRQEYARTFIKYFVYALAHDIEKMIIVNFKYFPPHDHGNPPFTDNSALINSHDRKTPLFFVVQTFIQRFDHFSSADIILETIEDGQDSNGEKYVKVTAGQYKFTVEGRTHYILWGDSELPQEITGSVIVTDIYNNTSQMHSSEVVLTEEPIYLKLSDEK